MWFYQSSFARSNGLCIWFDALRASIERGSKQEGINFVDLGPSLTKSAEESKIKFGFENRTDWNKECDYHAGGFIEPLPYSELHLDEVIVDEKLTAKTKVVKPPKPPKVKREHKKGEGRPPVKKDSVVEAAIVKVVDDLCESVKRPLLNEGFEDHESAMEKPLLSDNHDDDDSAMKKPLLSDVQQ